MSFASLLSLYPFFYIILTIKASELSNNDLSFSFNGLLFLFNYIFIFKDNNLYILLHIFLISK
jgi:hypothetical protein